MNFLKKLFRSEDSSERPPDHDDYWYNPIGSKLSPSVRVTHENSVRIATVFSCVKVLSETIGSLPLITYRRLPNGGKEEAVDHPLYNLLKYQPNRYQTKYDFIQMLVGHRALRGNFFSKMTFNRAGQAIEIMPMVPTRVIIEILDNDTLRFKYTDRKGKLDTLSQGQVFRTFGMSMDGIQGLSVIQEARKTFEGAALTQEFANNFFGNSAQPGGILKSTMPMQDNVRDANKKQWEKAHKGVGNSHKVAVLYGMEWQAIGMTNEDSQFLDTRKFTRSEICGLFGVPPHMVGDLERATFSNIEHQSIAFYTNTIRPWLVSIEQAIKRDLILEDDIFVEFRADAILRGDAATRSEVYASALGSGGHQPYMTVNEIRAMENLNPIEGGEKLPEPPTTAGKEKDSSTKKDKKADVQI